MAAEIGVAGRLLELQRQLLEARLLVGLRPLVLAKGE
jgi:hypothetical protein